MQKKGVPLLRYPKLKRLMETGEPVCITFEIEGSTEEELREAVAFQKAVSFNGTAPEGEVVLKGRKEFPEKSGFLFFANLCKKPVWERGSGFQGRAALPETIS